MKDLFTNFYNKVLSFFNQAESNSSESAKSVACNRLKLVLMQDRTNLSPMIMEKMRGELIDLLSKYMVLDKELLDLNFEHEEEQVALMLSIPVIRAKNEEEIQEMLDAEAALKIDESSDDEEDDEDDSETEEETSEDDENSDDKTSEDEEVETSDDETPDEEDAEEEEVKETTKK